MKYSLTEDALRKLICSVKQRIDDHKHEVADVEDLNILTNNDIDSICTFEGGMDGGIIPIASKSNLGCVIIGDNLKVRADGTVYADEYIPESITNIELESILVLEEEEVE